MTHRSATIAVEAIITLLQTRDDNLPQPTRHTSTTPGFVNEKRPRDCPDCCANGRTMHGCETCGGSGTVIRHAST
jgi:DnaJ-class molecular chaperone